MNVNFKTVNMQVRMVWWDLVLSNSIRNSFPYIVLW